MIGCEKFDKSTYDRNMKRKEVAVTHWVEVLPANDDQVGFMLYSGIQWNINKYLGIGRSEAHKQYLKDIGMKLPFKEALQYLRDHGHFYPSVISVIDTMRSFAHTDCTLFKWVRTNCPELEADVLKVIEAYRATVATEKLGTCNEWHRKYLGIEVSR